MTETAMGTWIVIGAVHIVWPVTHRTFWVFISAVKHKTIIRRTGGARGTFIEAWTLGTTFPKSAAIVLMEMIVRGVVVEEVQTVRKEAAIILKTLGQLRIT